MVDPGSPIPLFHQIADVIRDRIRKGELTAGDELEPLRDAAGVWGVSLHTVRHAYAALARDGYVETLGTRGTRVASTVLEPLREEREAFIDRVIGAGREMGLEPSALARAIAAAGNSIARPTAHFAECSRWQSEGHAKEIADRYRVAARPWSLESDAELPTGTVLSTYFHYNDFRRRWPHRLREVVFVSISVDLGFADRLGALKGIRRIILCERDRETAEAVAGDVMAVLPPGRYDSTIALSGAPEQLLDGLAVGTAVVFSPRVWASLDADARAHPRAIEARYRIDDADLQRIGYQLGWMPRRRTA